MHLPCKVSQGKSDKQCPTQLRTCQAPPPSVCVKRMSDTNSNAIAATTLPYHVPVNVYTKRGIEGKRLQAITLQRAALHDALTAEKKVDRARAIHAWTELQEQIRIIDGKLKPGSINARTESDAGLRKRSRSRADGAPTPLASPVVYPAPGADSQASVVNESPAQGAVIGSPAPQPAPPAPSEPAPPVAGVPVHVQLAPRDDSPASARAEEQGQLAAPGAEPASEPPAPSSPA